MGELAKKLFTGPCEFIADAASYDSIPITNLREVAFIGRSNVGKSSLLNSLTRRKSLARVSNTPGRTKQLNFFSLNKKIILVDLPGYGYAKASKKEIKGWNNLIQDYLKGRRNLMRVFILIDSRHGFKNNDLEVMDLLDDIGLNYQVILTKVDKCSEKELSEYIVSLEETIRKRPAAHPNVIYTSSRSNIGMDSLRINIAKII